jgi:catechol 2,3-dioxygenase-like lactoylglutathione lyase family enzyme
MPGQLVFQRMNHVNAIVDGFDAAIDHHVQLFGAQLLQRHIEPETDNCLLAMGGVIIELFTPKGGRERGMGRLLDTYGHHYQGVEWLVPSTVEALDVIRERGIRVIYGVEGVFFMTHPADCLGVSLEIFDGDWHRTPKPPNFLEAIHPISYWSDEHPLGITGLKHLSQAVTDLDAAVDWYVDLVGTTELYREPRPNAGAMAAGLQMGIDVVELLAPVEEGRITEYIERYGPRLRATTFSVRDLGAVERYFADRGITMVPGDGPRSLAIPVEQNYGLLYEFAESK